MMKSINLPQPSATLEVTLKSGGTSKYELIKLNESNALILRNGGEYCNIELEGDIVYGYDGVFDLSPAAISLLQRAGYNCEYVI